MFQEQILRAQHEARIRGVLEKQLADRRIAVMRQIYTQMGFEVVTDNRLRAGSIDVKSRFVDDEVDKDFYRKD